jgi:hypothetical protein
MSNRYDRDYSSDDFGRRDDREGQLGYRHEDEDREYGQRSDLRSGRFGESNARPNRDQDYRSAQNRDHYRDANSYRDPSRDNRFNDRRFSGRDENREGSYYPYSSNSGWNRQNEQYSQNRNQGSYFGPDRNNQDRFNQDRYNQDRYNQDRVRGIYQEQVWTRDPSSGNLYGYEYSTRVPASSYDSSYRDADRWSDRRDDNQGRRDWTSNTRKESWESRRGPSQFGKGPKGYIRSDERIREDVCDRLSEDDEVDASEITVTVSNGEVRLEGTVMDRHSKHRAEDIAESVSGVRDVSNHLRTRKGFFQELGDKLSGDDDNEHRGHAGSGTRNSPSGSAPKSNVAATGTTGNR